MMLEIFFVARQSSIPINAVFDEVHRSNMSKLGADNKPIIREDGKVLKGPNYSPPDIKAVLDAHVR
jgi:predicted HAD superfamily Cof-like phosphohydrolase